MDSSVKNYLYRNPQLYEIVYPEPNEDTPQMCLEMFSKYLKNFPSSVLDIGCGTARDLEVISRYCQDCWGIDYLPEMISYARGIRPHLKLQVGDMLAVRLQRKFDVIMCMGSTFMYNFSNTDVQNTLEIFSIHAHKKTLLILDIRNASSFLSGGHFRERIERKIDHPRFRAIFVSLHTFERREQLLIRERTWDIPGKGAIKDYCKYRLFFPMELEYLLNEKGFKVLGMFDNKELKKTDLSGQRLYVAALYKS